MCTSVYGMKLWNSLENDLKCGSNIISIKGIYTSNVDA